MIRSSDWSLLSTATVAVTGVNHRFTEHKITQASEGNGDYIVLQVQYVVFTESEMKANGTCRVGGDYVINRGLKVANQQCQCVSLKRGF